MSWRRLTWVLALVGSRLAAQTSSEITGQVIDQSKAAVPGAAVIVRGVDTGVEHRTVTNGDGYYTVPSLPVERYTVSAEYIGFKKAVSAPFKLDTAASVRVDLTLSPGDVTQTVEITDNATAIETEKGMAGSTVSQKELEFMPLQGRNILDMTMTVPGVAGEMLRDEPGIEATPTSPGSGVSISGGRISSVAFQTDGASTAGLANGRATVTFSPDTIQEMKVITSSFSAQYGTTGGGVVSVVSKSGTNQLHATAYWFQQNPSLTARTFGNVLPPMQRRNDTGLVLSGPVWLPKVYNGRNKTFFLFSIEPKRVVNSRQVTTRVPTALQRTGDFTDWWVAPGQTQPLLYRQVQCYPSDSDCQQLRPLNRATNTATYPLFCDNCPSTQVGHVIPKQYINAATTNLLNAFPLPNMPYDVSGNNYVGWNGNIVADNRWNLKIDQQLNSSNRLTGRYTNVPLASNTWYFQPNTIYPSAPTSQRSQSRQAFLSDTATLSTRIVNEARASYLFGNYSMVPPLDVYSKNYTRDVFGLPSQTTWGYPGLNLGQTGMQNLGTWPPDWLGLNIEHQYQFSDDLTMIFGRHTMRAGVDLRNQQLNMKSSGLGDVCCGTYRFSGGLTQSGNANSPGGTGGLGIASFELGVPNIVSLRAAMIAYYYRWKQAASYFQDDFKVTPNLTLNLGVRYQWASPRAEKFGRQATVDLDHPVPFTAANGSGGITFNYVFANSPANPSPYIEASHRLNFEPRFGFAWTPSTSWNRGKKLVLRGGYGFNHLPQSGRSRAAFPDLGGTQSSWTYTRWTGTGAAPKTQSADPASLIRLGRNAPVVIYDPTLLALPSDGKICIGCVPADPRLPTGDVISFNRHNQAPYIQTWNLTMQRAFPKDFVLTISYIGTKGTHLFSPPLGMNQPNLDQFQALLRSGGDPSQSVPNPFGLKDANGNLLNTTLENLMRPYPTMGNIQMMGNTNADSIYHAGTLEIERRFAGGLGMRFNYTRAKSIDNAADGSMDQVSYGLYGRTWLQNPNALGTERGVALYDQKHRINYTTTWEVPVGRGRKLLGHMNRWLDAAAGGWTVNAVGGIFSGWPFAPNLGTSNYNGIPDAGGNIRPRPDCLVGVPIINPLWNHGVANSVPYFNPAAFAEPEFGQLGNCSRVLDWARAPWTRTLNASVTKYFYPFENRQHYIQLRAEFFNAFNHPTFYVNSGVGKGLFSVGTVPVSASGTSLAGPIPYCQSGGFAAGSREATLCNYANPDFGLLYLPNNGPGRSVQIAIKLYW